MHHYTYFPASHKVQTAPNWLIKNSYLKWTHAILTCFISCAF